MRRRILTIIGGMGTIGCSICGAFVPVRVSAYSTTEFMLSNSATPTISISMDQPIVGNGNLDQIEGLPSSASFYKPIEISAGSIKSYYVSVYLDCSNLSGNDKTKCESGNLLTSSGDTLKSVDSAKTFGTMSNEWGFRYNIGDSAQDPSDKYFAPLPTTKANGYLQYNGAEQIRTDASTGSDNKILTLGFGAKVNGSTAAGIYNGKIAVAVVATPSEIAVPAFGGITTMQAMTHNICASAGVHNTAYLTDTRDNKKYWVTKLEDGHCWMSQNLDLDIYANESDGNVYAGTFDKYEGNTGGTLSSTGVKLTKDNTDITTDTLSATKMPKSTIQDVSIAGANVNTGDNSKYSWDQGLYVIDDPTATARCDHNSDGISHSSCNGKFTDVSSGWVAAEDPNFTKIAKDEIFTQDGVTKTKTSEAGSPIDDTNKVYDAHYLIGNYYQFNAATAGSATNGNTNIAGTDNGHAPDSLCPSGWKLPSTNTMEDINGRGSYPYMLNKYNIATGVNTGQLSGNLNGETTNIVLSPLFFVRSGLVTSPDGKLYYAGTYGFGWSARVNESNIKNAYWLQFGFNDSTVSPSNSADRYLGRPMRCVMY